MTVNKGIVLTDIVGKKIKFDILQTIIWHIATFKYHIQVVYHITSIYLTLQDYI